MSVEDHVRAKLHESMRLAAAEELKDPASPRRHAARIYVTAASEFVRRDLAEHGPVCAPWPHPRLFAASDFASQKMNDPRYWPKAEEPTP